MAKDKRSVFASDNDPGADEHEERQINARMASWRESYRPHGPEQEWFFRQVVVNSVRVDRAQRDEFKTRRYEARRASLYWDEDRSRNAEILGATLHKRPSLVVSKLRQTRQGCEWLLARWKVLQDILEAGETWSGDQCRLASDLLGTPTELRLDNDWDSPDTALALLKDEIETLEHLHDDVLTTLDAIEREAAMEGQSFEPSPALKRLRREESCSFKRFQWARKQLLNPESSPIVETPTKSLVPQTQPKTPSPSPATPTGPAEAAPSYEESVEYYKNLERDIIQKFISDSSPSAVVAKLTANVAKHQPLPLTTGSSLRQTLKT